jgi:glycerol uptake facilitator-like aquaporin
MVPRPRLAGVHRCVGDWALSQLWVFWLAPIAGALAAGWLYKGVLEFRAEPDIAGRP